MKSYNLSISVTVDEPMVAFKGLLSIQQYMKAKPVKFRGKVWALED